MYPPPTRASNACMVAVIPSGACQAASATGSVKAAWSTSRGAAMKREGRVLAVGVGEGMNVSIRKVLSIDTPAGMLERSQRASSIGTSKASSVNQWRS